MTACKKNLQNKITNFVNSECNVKMQEFFETKKQYNETIYFDNNKF